jgi:hypothetical protein
LSLSLRAARAASATEGCGASCAHTGTEEAKNHPSVDTSVNFRDVTFDDKSASTASSFGNAVRERSSWRLRGRAMPTSPGDAYSPLLCLLSESCGGHRLKVLQWPMRQRAVQKPWHLGRSSFFSQRRVGVAL